MKKLFTLIFTIFVCLLADNLKAQVNKREKIEAIKIGFITQRLNLSPDDSQNFWPIYNQYQKEINDLILQRRASKNTQVAEAAEAFDEQIEIDERILEVRKKYRKEFSKVLSPDKINQLYIAEKDFRNELIKQLKNR